MKRYYEIANLIVEMDSFGRTARQSEPYLVNGEQTADVSIFSNRERFQEKYPFASEDESEYYCSAFSFYSQLVNYDGLMLHASGVIMDGKAYLFSAPCGMGKSTHTKLWLAVFGDKAAILNDDKPALRRIGGQWYAYGTPWSGKHDVSINTRVPLGGICILGRGEVNKIEPYGGANAVKDLLEQTLRLKNPGFMSKLLKLLDELLTEVLVWRMTCNMEPEAALVSYRAMSGRKGKPDET